MLGSTGSTTDEDDASIWSPFQIAPASMIEDIIVYLKFSSIGKAALVSRNWSLVVLSPVNGIWHFWWNNVLGMKAFRKDLCYSVLSKRRSRLEKLQHWLRTPSQRNPLKRSRIDEKRARLDKQRDKVSQLTTYIERMREQVDQRIDKSERIRRHINNVISKFRREIATNHEWINRTMNLIEDRKQELVNTEVNHAFLFSYIKRLDDILKKDSSMYPVRKKGKKKDIRRSYGGLCLVSGRS